MKVWITKYALTYGILVTRNASFVGTMKAIVTVDWGTPVPYADTFDALDWHLSLEAALRRANSMKAKKIISLEKRLLNLQNSEIKIVELQSTADDQGGSSV